MDKKYDHKISEKKIYKMWEDGGYFKPKIDLKKKPFTIILPPPNASGKMHIGNVLMIAIEDILIRWNRMKGVPSLWVPGTDHAGFETQTTFERELKEQGKSRLDFDRETLYKNIWDFVYKNKEDIDNQIRSMGASVDWDRYVFTLDKKSLDVVIDTFKRMEKENLVYRDDYVVNYSFKWGTTFSDAEIVYKEKKSPLYYIKYGPFTLATVRPETKFGDTAVAVHPNDKRYQKYVGKEIEVEGLNGNFKLKVIADTYVDPHFGTGVVKITPGHDKNDFEVGARHNLKAKNIIGLNGRLNEFAGKYAGLKILEARARVVEDLKKRNLLVKVDENYTHLAPVDYRTGDYIENLILPNWFIKVEDLAKKALEVVKSGNLKIYPKWREKTYVRWVENMHDWAISRQVVWGIRIPAWYSVKENPNLNITFLDPKGNVCKGKILDLLQKYNFDDIAGGLQSLIASKESKYVVSRSSPGKDYLQETDTFDTWFSSGQWPLICTGYPSSKDFDYFYPTNVLETGWEIVTKWVSRMVMFGMYLDPKGLSPFKDVYLHGMVRALDGKKMSKSLGNVINPEEYQNEYGTDALRMGLIAGTANGKDFSFPRDKVIAYRNFANKIWNMARFILMMFEKRKKKVPMFRRNQLDCSINPSDREILEKLNKTIKKVDSSLNKYRFADAGEVIYHFVWDDLASNYLERVKTRKDMGTALSVLRHVFINSLKLLHPFMPFVTEEIWGKIPRKNKDMLIISAWPKVKN